MKNVIIFNNGSQTFGLNCDNIDIVWSFDEENKLYLNIGAVQYIFKIASAAKASDVCANIISGKISSPVAIEGWWTENNLGEVDVVKLN